jgi:hypothetical protein
MDVSDHKDRTRTDIDHLALNSSRVGGGGLKESFHLPTKMATLSLARPLRI